MKKVNLIFILFSLLVTYKSYSQEVQISKPLLEFDGDQLVISYDIIGEKQSDLFYVWIEMENSSRSQIKMKSLSGSIGSNIRAGKNKKILWIPENDSILLNEDISVRIKAEKYIKAYNKGSMILLSAAFPGWGESRISNGKPWWLVGVVSYGALAGGLIFNQAYLKTYSDYNSATTVASRADLLARSQKQFSTSNALFISGAAIWAANIVWVTLTPERYKPLQYVKLTLMHSPSYKLGAPGLELSLNF